VRPPPLTEVTVVLGVPLLSAQTNASSSSLPAEVEKLLVDMDELKLERSPLATASMLRFCAGAAPAINSITDNNSFFIFLVLKQTGNEQAQECPRDRTHAQCFVSSQELKSKK
jgi:hypothetical protein